MFDDGGNSSGYNGKATACIEAKDAQYPKNAGYNYFYYHVLIAR